MTLFPYCTDIILCISTRGTPSAHKNGSLPSALLWCKWNWEWPCLWQKKTHNRNGLSRSHLHHNVRWGADHVYFVMTNQQYSNCKMYTYSADNFWLTYVFASKVPKTGYAKPGILCLSSVLHVMHNIHNLPQRSFREPAVPPYSSGRRCLLIFSWSESTPFVWTCIWNYNTELELTL